MSKIAETVLHDLARTVTNCTVMCTFTMTMLMTIITRGVDQPPWSTVTIVWLKLKWLKVVPLVSMWW